MEYSITDKDNASTCESLDINDEVVGWIKAIQPPKVDEHCSDSYPTNEEILNYVCSRNSRYYDGREINENMECQEISETTEEGLCTSANSCDNSKEAIYSTVDCDNTKSVLLLNRKSVQDGIVFQQKDTHDVAVFCDKESNLRIQEAIANGDKDHIHSSQNEHYVILNNSTTSVPNKVCDEHTTCHCYPLYKDSKTKCISLQDMKFSSNNKAMSQVYNSECTEITNSEQLSLDLSDKFTEDTLTSSLSSCSINISLVEVDYIKFKSPIATNNEADRVNQIPIQSKNVHQTLLTHLDGPNYSITTAAEGEYIDHNIAVQQTHRTS